jgi:nucleoside phosphorylase
MTNAGRAAAKGSASRGSTLLDGHDARVPARPAAVCQRSCCPDNAAADPQNKVEHQVPPSRTNAGRGLSSGRSSSQLQATRLIDTKTATRRCRRRVQRLSRRAWPDRSSPGHLLRNSAEPSADLGRSRCAVNAHERAAVVILTALSLEYRSVRRWLHGTHRVDHPAGTVFEVGWLPSRAGMAALAVAGVGNLTAAVIGERAIAMFQPRALLFVGVAGALRDEIALGDVVVATRTYGYHGGASRSSGFEARPRSWETSHRLEQIARQVHESRSWLALLPHRRAAIPAVHFGPVAAGEVVLNTRSGAVARRLRLTYGDAIAIEMEGAGIAHAAHLNHGLPVLIVRGISDNTDGCKATDDEAGWQLIGSGHAAAFALAVATDLCTRPLGRNLRSEAV